MTDTPRDWRPIAAELRRIIPRGLVAGLGEARPGAFCVEAAKAWVLGERHGDRPSCDAQQDRDVAYTLNDGTWSSDQARAAAMLPVALAGLGSAGHPRDAWVQVFFLGLIRKVVPAMLRCAVWHGADPGLLLHADACATVATLQEAPGPLAAASEAATTAGAQTDEAAADDLALAAAALANVCHTYSKHDPLRSYAAEMVAFGVTDRARTYTAYAADPAIRDFILQTAVEVALDAYRAHPHPGMIPPEEWFLP